MLDKDSILELKLFDFYEKTYELHLGNYKGLSYKSLFEKKSFTDYIESILNDRQLLLLKTRKSHYNYETSKNSKLSKLIHYIQKSNLKDIKIVDIGCGNGDSTKYLSKKVSCDKTFTKTYLIDKYISPKSLLPHEFHFKNLDKIELFDQIIDICMFVHSMHHMTEVELHKSLTWCSENMNSGATLYVVEDSWNNSYTAENDYDKWFYGLDSKQKHKLFRINDIQSNLKFYDSNFSLDYTRYRESGEWTKLIEKFGFTKIEEHVSGFSFSRLHGVPQVIMIFKKNG